MFLVRGPLSCSMTTVLPLDGRYQHITRYRESRRYIIQGHRKGWTGFETAIT